MRLATEILESLLHLAFPHICEGCGSDVLPRSQSLCLRCRSSLPCTYFHLFPQNPVEKAFWGRIPVSAATAQYYFTRGSVMQHLMHQLKYRNNPGLGIYLGRLMGMALNTSARFRQADALVPLPLHPRKEKMRGYNQAALLCQGISEIMKKPLLTDAVIRGSFTESQTKKSRVERWRNMEGIFLVPDLSVTRGRHLLLVDDVITTGATLEACGHALLHGAETRVSIATLCFSSR